MQFHDAFAPGAHLSESFQALKRHPASLLVGAVLVGFVSAGPNAMARGLGQLAETAGDNVDLGLAAALLAVVLLLTLLGWFAQCWLTPGWLRVQARALDPQGREDVSLLFSGGDCFGRMVGWTTLSGTITLGIVLIALLCGVVTGGAVLAVTGGSMTDLEGAGVAGLLVGLGMSVLVGVPSLVYVSLGMALGTHALVLEGLSPMDALSRSWDLVAGNRTSLLFFLLVVGLVNFVGFLMCCIGGLPAGIVTNLATTRGWILLTQGAQAKV